MDSLQNSASTPGNLNNFGERTGFLLRLRLPCSPSFPADWPLINIQDRGREITSFLRVLINYQHLDTQCFCQQHPAVLSLTKSGALKGTPKHCGLGHWDKSQGKGEQYSENIQGGWLSTHLFHIRNRASSPLHRCDTLALILCVQMPPNAPPLDDLQNSLGEGKENPEI